MNFEKGDLVFGTRPWNEGTTLGVIVDKAESSSDLPTFRVFWMNQGGNTFSSAPSFLYWEMPDAIRKVEIT